MMAVILNINKWVYFVIRIRNFVRVERRVALLELEVQTEAVKWSDASNKAEDDLHSFDSSSDLRKSSSRREPRSQLLQDIDE
jgi:hypothetical protein